MIDLTFEQLKKLAEYIHKEAGIFLEEEKLRRFKRKIEAIFIKNHVEDFNTFYHQLRFMHNEKFIQELINAVTVNETYFWREHEQFHILVKEVLPLYVKTSSIETIRILVAPTSSGEELYSLMLSILEDEQLLNSLNIELIGIDIDSQMVAKAKQGIYTKRSVEKLPHTLLKKYFHKIGDLYQLDKKLIKSVHFTQVNIFDTQAMSKLGKFDIIFSRNMLIYFNQIDKQKAYTLFYNLLKERAYLFLGHADANKIDKSKFQAMKNGLHIYRKI